MSSNEEIRQLLNQRRNEKGQFSSKNVWSIAEELGLDMQDLRVAALSQRDLQREFKNDNERYGAVLRLARDMHYHRPTDADVPSEIAKRTTHQSRQEQLEDEYRHRSQGLSGHQLIRLKLEMRKKGWTGT